MKSVLKLMFLRAWASLLFVSLIARGFACCVIGISDYPKMRTQESLIIWDSKNRVEHFYRQADFLSKSKEVGFIAPTPSVPKLAEADSKLFQVLNAIVGKEEERRKKVTLNIGCAATEKAEVLQSVRVAGYVATTLSAENATQVFNWAEKNGYLVDPSIRSWLDEYIAKKWCLTLFKVDRTDDSSNPQTGIVKMSFSTDIPFNPFRVPKSNVDEGASQTVTFISDDFYRSEQMDSHGMDMYLTDEEWSEIQKVAYMSDLQIKTPRLSHWVFADFAKLESSTDMEFRRTDLHRAAARWLPSTNVQFSIFFILSIVGIRVFFKLMVPAIRNRLVPKRN
jgi:hypothetical protein